MKKSLGSFIGKGDEAKAHLRQLRREHSSFQNLEESKAEEATWSEGRAHSGNRLQLQRQQSDVKGFEMFAARARGEEGLTVEDCGELLHEYAGGNVVRAGFCLSTTAQTWECSFRGRRGRRW